MLGLYPNTPRRLLPAPPLPMHLLFPEEAGPDLLSMPARTLHSLSRCCPSCLRLSLRCALGCPGRAQRCPSSCPDYTQAGPRILHCWCNCCPLKRREPICSLCQPARAETLHCLSQSCPELLLLELPASGLALPTGLPGAGAAAQDSTQAGLRGRSRILHCWYHCCSLKRREQRCLLCRTAAAAAGSPHCLSWRCPSCPRLGSGRAPLRPPAAQARALARSPLTARVTQRALAHTCTARRRSDVPELSPLQSNAPLQGCIPCQGYNIDIPF